MFVVAFVVAVLIATGLEILLLEMNRRELLKVGSEDFPSTERHRRALSLFDKAKLEQAAEYNLAQISVARVELVFSAVVALSAVVWPWPRLVFNFVESLTPSAGSWSSVLSLLTIGALMALTAIPFSLYKTFVIEERFGFNRSSFMRWLKDSAISLSVSALISSLLFWALLFFLESAADYWWLFTALVLIVLQLTMLIVYPLLLAPMFNKFTPIEEEDLSQGFRDLASKAEINISEVLEMDASKRSSHGNAYFAGLGRSKRVVIFDTLRSSLENAELKAVIAHELGHAARGHLMKSLTFSSLLIASLLFVSNLLKEEPSLYSAFGFSEPSAAVFLMFLVFFSSPFLFFLSPLFHVLSRRFEFEADRASLEYFPEKGALASALMSLSRDNLSNPLPHKWYSFFHYSHPTLIERLDFIASEEQALGLAA